MPRNNHFLWLAVGAVALMGFSFAAGYGLRALLWAVEGRAALAEGAFTGYTRLASRAGVETTVVGHGQVFAEVMHRLKELFVEPLPPASTLSQGAVDGMLTLLQSTGDADTRLIGAKEWGALTEEASGAFRGLGAVLTVRRYQGDKNELPKTQITVVTPMPGSPAEKAGLLPGDRITSLDSHWIAPQHLLKRTLNMLTEESENQFDPTILQQQEGVPEEDRAKPLSTEERKQREEQFERWRASTDLDSALSTLSTASEGEHTLIIERGSLPAKTVKVTFGKTVVTPIVKKKLAPTVAYLQVRRIDHAAKAVDQALTEFRASGLKSLVLDLRHNPGGTLPQAQEIASRFLTAGSVAVLEKRDSARKLVKKPLPVKSLDRRAKFSPIAVLVDGGTAGASKVLAAALRDAGVAKLVGDKTFGDGTEQTIFPLENGAAVSITTAKMLTRNGTDFDGKGLKPDVAVPASAGADHALDQALHLVRPS